MSRLVLVLEPGVILLKIEVIAHLNLEFRDLLVCFFDIVVALSRLLCKFANLRVLATDAGFKFWEPFFGVPEVLKRCFLDVAPVPELLAFIDLLLVKLVDPLGFRLDFIVPRSL